MKILPRIFIAAILISISIFFLRLSYPSLFENPLELKYMLRQTYPGSEISIAQTLEDGVNYKRYIVSYFSGGLKEYAYMTVPKIKRPQSGFPVIIFNHGYQIPKLYTPDGNYIAYMDSIASAGYIVFKPDYRGNGKSQGMPTSAYFSPDYTVDVLNAISSIKKYKDANPGKIGIWGHSMGGQISLRVAEISSDIKVVVIWGGVVGSYNDIIYNWQDKVSYKPEAEDLYLRNLGLSILLARYGTPEKNLSFWKSIDPFYNINLVNAPIQIHVGSGDNQVPPKFSKDLYNQLIKNGKKAEYYEYAGANHDINQGFSVAMKRTINYFDKYLRK